MTAKEYVNNNPVSSTQDNITKELLERDVETFAKIKCKEMQDNIDAEVERMREEGETDLRVLRDQEFIPEDLC